MNDFVNMLAVFVIDDLLIIASIVATVAAAGVGAYASYAQGQAQKEASEFNAKVAENNAMAAEQQGQFDAQQIRDKNRRLVASQRAAYAASGVDPNSGSPLDVYRDTKISGELEALTAIYTGRTSANAQTAQASLDRARANSASNAGTLGAASSLLGGAVSATGTYTSYRSTRNPRF